MKFPRRAIEVAGWAPAIIFPMATVKQLHYMVTNPTADADVLTWFLFGLANLCLYIYSEKYFRPQALLGFLGTAVLDFVIVVLAL